MLQCAEFTYFPPIPCVMLRVSTAAVSMVSDPTRPTLMRKGGADPRQVNSTYGSGPIIHMKSQ